MHASDFGVAPFVQMHLGHVLTARGDYDAAERLLRAGVDRWRASGRAASAYEMSIYLADCLVRSGRPQEGLEAIAHATGAEPEEVAIFEATRAVVSAGALMELGFVNEAVETISEGVELARERALTFDLARLLLLADQIGPPFDERLGTTKPVEEAQRLFDRLGVVSTVSA